MHGETCAEMVTSEMTRKRRARRRISVVAAEYIFSLSSALKFPTLTGFMVTCCSSRLHAKSD